MRFFYLDIAIVECPYTICKVGKNITELMNFSVCVEESGNIEHLFAKSSAESILKKLPRLFAKAKETKVSHRCRY